MHDPNQMPGEPLDLDRAARGSRLLRWSMTGASAGGDAASAVYGTILAGSVLVAVGGGPGLRLVAVVATGVVFWLAHAHVALMRRVVRRGEHVHVREVRRALTEEWPLVQAGLTPAAPLVLAWAGVVSTATAVSVGLGLCLVGLVAWGIAIARAAGLGRGQTAIAIGVNLALGLALVALKAILH